MTNNADIVKRNFKTPGLPRPGANAVIIWKGAGLARDSGMLLRAKIIINLLHAQQHTHIFLITFMDVRSSIRSFLKNAAPNDAGFSDSDNLLAKGVIDSLRMLDLMSLLDEKYRLKVEDDDLMPENFESVNAITRFVEEKIKA